jgi:hypothetical protein
MLTVGLSNLLDARQLDSLEHLLHRLSSDSPMDQALGVEIASVTNTRATPPRRGASRRQRVVSDIQMALGQDATRIGGQASFQCGTGGVFHVRSMKAHPRGPSEFSYWFGVGVDQWVSGEFIVFVCGDDADFVVPIDFLSTYEADVPLAKDGTEYQPTIWRRGDGTFELRVGHHHVDLSEWRDRFDLLG